VIKTVFPTPMNIAADLFDRDILTSGDGGTPAGILPAVQRPPFFRETPIGSRMQELTAANESGAV
jgi:hypothetical protein